MLQRLLPGDKAVEHFEQGVGDGLTKRVDGNPHILLVSVANSERKMGGLVGNNALGALDRPQREIAVVVDGNAIHDHVSPFAQCRLRRRPSLARSSGMV